MYIYFYNALKYCVKGHDTTTAGINWSLFLSGSEPKVQVLDQFQNFFSVELLRLFLKK